MMDYITSQTKHSINMQTHLSSSACKFHDIQILVVARAIYSFFLSQSIPQFYVSSAPASSLAKRRHGSQPQTAASAEHAAASAAARRRLARSGASGLILPPPPSPHAPPRLHRTCRCLLLRACISLLPRKRRHAPPPCRRRGRPFCGTHLPAPELRVRHRTAPA